MIKYLSATKTNREYKRNTLRNENKIPFQRGHWLSYYTTKKTKGKYFILVIKLKYNKIYSNRPQFFMN